VWRSTPCGRTQGHEDRDRQAAADEDAASNARDYQRAAEIKVERLRKDEEFKASATCGIGT